MKTPFIALAAAALLASSAAFAAGPAAAPKAVKPEAVAHEQTLVDELARGAREILAAVVPEISLPKLEIKLPAEVRGRR